MRYRNDAQARSRAGGWSCLLGVSAFLAVLAGCGGSVDSRFAAETYDEYTEPLTNAVVGTPAGIVIIGPTGVATDAGSATGGPIAVSGGSSSSGSSSGVGVVSGSGAVTGSSGGGMGGGGPVAGSGSGSGSGGGGRRGGGSSGGPATDGGAGGGGFGSWSFDDCSPTSNFLADTSGNGANAQHALGAACVPGISGLGVQIRNAKDVIQVPDEPQFTVGPRVAVAAWVHPSTVSGDQPIVIKRLNNQTSFSLGIHNGNIEMSVVLTTGTTVISRAPIAANTWTHVAGMYDGTFVFLFINGQQFGQVFGGGTLRNVFAPVRFGATTQTQHFAGIIDQVFVSTQVLTATDIEALSCLQRPTTFTVNPSITGPVPFDTDVHYDVVATNNDTGFCAPKTYEFFPGTSVFPPDPTTVVTAEQPQFTFPVAPGTSVTFGAEVTLSDNAPPGLHQIPFQLDAFSSGTPFGFELLSGQLNYDLVAPTGCFVFTGRELMITDVSVVDDPVRTSGVFIPGGFSGSSSSGGFFDGGFGSSSGGGSGAGGSSGGGSGSSGGLAASSGSGGDFDASLPPPPIPVPTSPAIVKAAATVATSETAATPSSQGVWTFGHLMRELAPTPADAPAMTLALFSHWLTDQTVNSFTVSARPAIQQVLLDIWPKTATGDLDLDQPPLTLQAIANRIDLRNLNAGSAGEGRFIFAVNGFGFPQSFTVILEYNLPAQTQKDVQDWANLWHGLSSHPFPSEEYNAALEAITRRFAGRNASPGSPNGSALIELRTNEIALSFFQWELRAFQISPTTGFFDETTVKETPDLGFLGTQTFSDFVNQNAPAIIAEIPGANDNTVPLVFERQSFLAGSVFNNQVEWFGPNIANPDARFHASQNTCNGCHGPETATPNFTMITPRQFGTESVLSPFLTGVRVTDAFSGQVRALDDLARRQADLASLVCSNDGGASPPPTPPPPPIPVPVPARDGGAAKGP